MFKLSLENDKGGSIILTDNNNYAITDIDGLNPPSASIQTSETSLFDGEKFVSSKVDMRTLDVAFVIQRRAEENRLALYDVIRTKQYIKLNFQNGERNVFIEGYVSDFTIDYFANMQEVTVSITCPEPFFKDAAEIVANVNVIIKKFTFPFAISSTAKVTLGEYEEVLEVDVVNDGDVETGMTIEIHANDTVKNPTIYNRDTTEFFGLDIELEAGDSVFITTTRGQKRVRLFRDAVYTNIFNKVRKDSAWLQLARGDNIFTYEADEDTTGNMDVIFTYRHLYQGV